MYLANCLTEQTLMVMRYDCDGPVISYREMCKLLGRLFALILSSMKRRGYRIRTHINNTHTCLQNGRFPARLFGCLSFESTAFDAEYNRMDRLGNYVNLHQKVNPLVSTTEILVRIPFM